MEQFVLGIFQEQLSKFIVGFRKEQVNANLLNGKGEIRDVELNCDFLNQSLSVVTPLIELQSVKVSKLSFHVTSWTNIRKAPILVDIEHVTATLVEPLTYEDARSDDSNTDGGTTNKRRRRLRQITQQQLLELIQRGVIKSKSSNTPYSLLDRIIDNLTVEVESVNVTFQPRGRFKTTRPGPWTPPAIHLTLADLSVVSVNEFGHEAPPAEIWKHNHHHRSGGSSSSSSSSLSSKGCFLIYKKISMEYRIALRPYKRSKSNHNVSDNSNDDIPLISGRNNKVCLHVAMKRRVRDSEWMAVQLDATIPKVEIDIPQHAVPVLAHALAGIQYCLAKDRAFQDPLNAEQPSSSSSTTGDHDSSHSSDKEHYPIVTSISGGASYDDDDHVDDDDDDDGIRLGDTIDESSSSSSDQDEAEISMAQATTMAAPKKSSSSLSNPTTSGSASAAAISSTKTSPPRPSSSARYALPAGMQDQPVLILPTGLLIHEKLSISFCIHHASVRGTYASSKNNMPPSSTDSSTSTTTTPTTHGSESAAASTTDGHFLIVSKGFVAEAIWPKVTKEKGGYVQASVSYLAIKETYGERAVTLVSGGVEQYEKSRPLEQASQPLPEVKRDETFPLFEDRVVRPDPMGIRHSFPAQAFGVKTTVEFVKKLSKSDTATTNDANVGGSFDDDDEDIRVLHEVGVDRFDIAADSLSWSRILHFAVNEHGGGFDPRWYSGNWSERIAPDMLLNPSGGRLLLNLDECLQPTKQLFLDENAFISSDLFNLTARVTNIDFRIPAAIHKDVKSCTVAVRLTEVMLLVSSALPRTLEEKGNIHFPNDPSDVAYTLERLEDPSMRQRGIMTTRAISTFRAQVTYRGVSVRLVPVIPFYVAKEPQQLLAPAELTMIMCFEGEPPESEASNLAKIVLFTSIQVHRLEVNLDFDLLAAALITLLHHAECVKSAALSIRDTLSNNSQQPDASTRADATTAATKDGKIKKTFRGRRVLVRKQMNRSRETGGLSLAVGVKVADFSLRLWRQFVPCTGPLRSSPPRTEDNGLSPRFLPLVQVARFEVKDTELGVEATLRKQHRRVVVKGRFSEIEMKACDLAAMCSSPDSGVAMDQTTHHDNNYPGTEDELENDVNRTAHESFLATLLCLGKQHENTGGEYAAALRCEEHLLDERCWSLAADIAKGGIVNCRPEEIESLAVLVFEALLMPAMSNFDKTVFAQYKNDLKIFPDGTIGWLLASIVRTLVGTASDTPGRRSKTAKDSKSPNTAPDGFSVKSINMAIRNLMRKVVPDNVETILCRAQICDMLITVAPKPVVPSQSTGPSFSLHLQSADFLATHLPSRLGKVHPIFDVVACKGGETWSSMVGDSREAGLRHRLASQQSLRTTCLASDAESLPTSAHTGNDLVPPFDFSYSYAKSRATVSMSDTFEISNVEKVDDCLLCILDFVGRCKRVTSNMLNVVGTLRGSHKLAGGAVVESTAEIPYMEKPCSRTAESLASMRGLLRKLNERLVTQDYNTKNILGDRNRQLESMRMLVFTKEKERAAALALVSSQATGWLRIGNSSRTGQRGELTSTLWAYWSILRRGLLIIYQGPGQAKPLDVIPLQFASLRQLSGGQRKRDLKRAFALVQSSGMVRLIVVGSDNEYRKWITELRRSINAFSPLHDIQDSTHSGGSGTEHSLGDNDNLRPVEGEDLSEPANQGRSLGKGLSRAVQAARASKHAVVDRSIRRRKESDDVIVPGIEDDAISQVTEQGASLIVSEPLDGSSHGGSSRQNIQSSFPGARSAAKSRFGSALEIARQKGREVVERRRQRTGAAADDDTKPQSSTNTALTSTPSSASLQWSCSTCTFLNPGTANKCEMCGTPTTDIVNAESTDRDGITLTMSPWENDDKEDVKSFDGSVAGLVGVRQRLGAAVRNRLITRDAPNQPERSSGRFNLLRGSNALHDGSDITGQENALPSVKIKNVVVGDELAVPVHPFCDEYDTVLELPLKRLEGRWFVRVEVARGRSEQSDVATATDVKPDDNTQQRNALSDSPLDLDKSEVETDAHNNFKAPETMHEVHPFFHIHVFKYLGIETHSKPTHTINRNLSEVLALHTELSESVSRILPISSPSSHSPKGRDRLANGDMKPSLAAALGLTALDAVRITGTLLGGLLGTQSEAFVSTSDAPMNFQVDVVADFLNSMIDSELPIDGLFLLADFLGIADVSSESTPLNEAQPRVAVDSDKPYNTTTTISEESSHDIHSLLSVFQGEILRAETHYSMLEQQQQQATKPFPVDKSVLLMEQAAATATATAAAAAAAAATPTTTLSILSLLNSSQLSPIIHPNDKKSDRFQQAMHAALIKAMEERDESHARMVAAEVLFAHELEQQKKKTNRLEAELLAVRIAAVADGKMDARKGQQDMQQSYAMNQLQQDSDEELVSLCKQLSEEISARTSSALEVKRLQESRRLEREWEEVEKAALIEQVEQLQQELARERANKMADD